MSKKEKNIFIGVAWPYVNGDVHIGHLAGYLLPCDIAARYHRVVGRNVLMASGSDCHGTPITVEADKKGVSPQEIANEYHEKDVSLFKDILNITYDIYTRTDTAHHAKVTQDIFISLLEAGFVFVDSSQQYYSATEKRFLPDRYVVGECPYCNFKESRSDQCDNCGKLIGEGELVNPISNNSKEKVELRETQHYYVDWKKLQPKIEKYVNEVSGEWKTWVSQETKGWLKEGLKPRPISRDIDWGVKLPVDRIPADLLIDNIENKRLYVWFDAVIGYYSASLLWAKENGKDWKEFWYGDNIKHYYFMGKDNLVFHTVFWPGKLIVHDPKLHLPDIESINQFLNFDGKQFSKSRGVTVDTKKIVETFGNSRVRFYITLTMPETKDSTFSWSDFEEKVNGILVANIGNFVHRSLSVGFKADLKKSAKMPVKKEVSVAITKAFENSREYLEKCEFRNTLDEIIGLSSFGNKLVDEYKIWELDNTSDKYLEAIRNLYLVILCFGYLLIPLLPHASKDLFDLLGLDLPRLWPEKGNEIKELKQMFEKINVSTKPKPLFEKVEKKDYENF